MQSLPNVVQDCHQCLLWVIPKLDNFPRNRRFTLGERIEGGLLDILEWLTAAAYSRNKRSLLSQANNRLAVVRHLWRLAFELKILPSKSYQYGVKLFDEIGRQCGAWLKSNA